MLELRPRRLEDEALGHQALELRLNVVGHVLGRAGVLELAQVLDAEADLVAARLGAGDGGQVALEREVIQGLADDDAVRRRRVAVADASARGATRGAARGACGRGARGAARARGVAAGGPVGGRCFPPSPPRHR